MGFVVWGINTCRSDRKKNELERSKNLQKPTCYHTKWRELLGFIMVPLIRSQPLIISVVA